jgi:hypothetical protein
MAKHEGNQGGRPEYIPTEADRNTVKSMAACGFTHEAIAICLGTDGIDPKTLRVHFRRELDTSMIRANAKVGNMVFQAAEKGEAWAICFWMKCRAHWKETSTLEHSGPGGGAIDVHMSSAEELRHKVDALKERVARKPQ